MTRREVLDVCVFVLRLILLAGILAVLFLGARAG